jgi:7-cyano-7-deazaguanine synthase
MLGGGVESTALVKRFLSEGRNVIPVHVHCGLIWDDCEARYVRRFCDANAGPLLESLVEIRLPLHDFLKGHWTVTGVDVPRSGASAADLEIPLRNLTLLSFALHRLRSTYDRFLTCRVQGSARQTPGETSVSTTGEITLALGTTADNCYRDGSRAYFDKCEEIFSLDAARPVRVLTPLIGLNKIQVIRSSDAATLALSFSCVNPRDNLHCGQCIKCGRRQTAFRAAGVTDPTVYAGPGVI